jgi:hypothetical protein
MSDEERDSFASVFPDRTTFSPEQKAVLRKFWLRVPSADALEVANEALDPDTRATPVTTTSGDLVVNIDLLTDAGTFGKAANMIRTWRVMELDPSTDFPQEEV